MEAFCELLPQLPRNEVRVFVKCFYTPSNDQAAQFPGRFVHGTVTLQFRPAELGQFHDWLRNDTANTLSPMIITWSQGESKIEINLDEETLKARSDDIQILDIATRYSQQQHLDLTIRSSRRQENWERSRNRVN
jgi:hypothetical protein